MKKYVVLAIIFISVIMVRTKSYAMIIPYEKQETILKTDKVSDDKVGNMSIARIMKILEIVKSIDDVDNGTMWGIPLATRVMVVDPDTRKVIATEADNKGKFKKIGDLYEGQLTDDVGIANTTIKYGGKQWAMILYSESDDLSDTVVTYVHEMFHNLQKELGQDSSHSGGYDNSHMDKMDARIYLKLEWEALHKALDSSGKEKEKAIADALAFRITRRNKYHSAIDENKFEIQEGMAEYTSERLVYSTDDSMRQILQSDWERYLDEKRTQTFIRSFGYHSGVLYGLLLDECSKDWRKSIKYDSDLGEMLRYEYNINLSDLSVEKSKNGYHFDEIYQYEYKRNQEREKITSQYSDKFIRGPILRLNLNHSQVSFNPNNIWELKDHGNVYETAEIIDDFGKIVVTKGGMLISSDWNEAFVPSKNIQISGKNIIGDGWSLKLKEGYMIKKQKHGCYIIIKVSDNLK